ncbi:MAG TPA: GYD domain-containing protein [Streptosporangiaceae bacterium]|nr:GYD domain-containing protein [Streptosporangiaceae bacterium]
MAMYLTAFSHTSETWARMLARPEDRRKVLGPVIESLGGKLHGLWYAFGDTDGYVLFEAPDDVTAGSLLVNVGAAGALAKVSTTKLFTVEEMQTALARAKDVNYVPPGVSG